MIAWEPHVTIRALQPVVAALQALDYDADSLLHKVQISPGILPQSAGRIPHHQLIIVPPNLHRIHHSSWQPETDSNFSAVFPIWDIIFGTFRPRSREPQTTMSLELEEVRDRRVYQLVWLLRSPFLRLEESNPLRLKLHS